jgi:protein gp37
LHCYAESLAHRYGHDVWGKGKPRRTFGDQHWKQPVMWNAAAEKAGRRAKVVCASMADVFDPEAPESDRQRLWRLIEQTPWLDWQLLTKRPELARRFLPPAWLKNPRPNVWIGVSVEDRKRKPRIVALRNIPAAVRFLSVEPLLEDLGEINLAGIDWVIVGGESGPGARPMNETWVTGVRDGCASAGVAFFFKQWGKLMNNPDQNDPTVKENGGAVKGGGRLNGSHWSQLPKPVQSAIELHLGECTDAI